MSQPRVERPRPVSRTASRPRPHSRLDDEPRPRPRPRRVRRIDSEDEEEVERVRPRRRPATRRPTSRAEHDYNHTRSQQFAKRTSYAEGGAPRDRAERRRSTATPTRHRQSASHVGHGSRSAGHSGHATPNPSRPHTPPARHDERLGKPYTTPTRSRSRAAGAGAVGGAAAMGGMVSDSEEDSPPRTRRSQPRRVPTRKSSRRRPRGAIVSSKRTIPLLEGSGQVVSDARSIKTSSSSVFYDAEDQDAVEAAHEKPRTNRDRKLAAVPHHQMNTMKQGRVFAMNGIDNVTLLMEDDSYHLACFSMYLFKTTLDYKTVREFFEVLVQLYPKYRYVVDFQPYTARRRDRLRRKQREDVAEQARKERNEKMKRGELPPNHGPRTLYSRSLKSGSWLRPAQWRIDEDFHVSENIEVISCGGTGTEDQVYKIAGRFLARHFDYNKPVWEALLIQGLNTSEGAKSALMIKIHHCFSDGQGMIQSYHAALMAMSKDMGIKEVQQWVDVAKKKNKANKKKEIKPTIGGTVSHSFYTMRELYFRKRKSFVYRNPKQARASQRLYYHSDGIPMAGIKRIRETFSTPNMHLTLNDVAVAILARAMALAANRLSPRGSKDDRRAAIFVPVSIRPEGNWDLYNYTTGAMVWLKYPDLDATPVSAQLAHVHKEMLRIKKSYLPSLWYHTFNEICKHRGMYVPNYPIARSIFYRAFSEYHVATNVPGPTEPVMFGKHQAYSYHVLPPSSPGKATMAIGMISYAANFSLAVSCDDVPEFKDVPRVLCDAFSESSKLLIEAAENHLAQAPSEKN